MNWQIYFWAIIGVIFFIAIGIGYLFTAKVYGYKLAIKSFAQSFAFIAIFSTTYYLIFLFIPTSYKSAFWITIYLAISIILIAALYNQIQGRRKIAVENILVDLGLDNNGFWLILTGLLFTMSSISSISDSIATNQLTAVELSHITFKFLAGILGFYIGISKTVITDEGIFSLAGYVKWSNIKSYKWENSKLPILKLKVKGSWFSLNTANINVSDIHRSTVQNLLSQKLSKAENA